MATRKSISEMVQKKRRPIRVVQFGEGNFLRGFVDYMLDVANEKGFFDGSVAVVKPISYGNLDAFREQDCIYTLSLKGKQDGRTVEERRIITSIDRAVGAYEEYETYRALCELPELRFIVSNTTEAGIVYDPSDSFELTPPNTYPGKLTKFLYERFSSFHGDPQKGVVLLPVELIERNGAKLKECVLAYVDQWNLGDAFRSWLLTSCLFCSTLVDRIVTGYPREEAPGLCDAWGYADRLIDTGEPFALWVIESDRADEVARLLPLDKAGFQVVFTDDLRPYRERKVRILNGAHTATVLAAYLAGKDIVRECMEDAVTRALMERVVYEEIAPTVPLPEDEVLRFARSVFERFENPFIRHSLLSISLNSVSKWKARLLPSFRDRYAQTGSLPQYLTFSFAALLAFYTGERGEDGAYYGRRGEERYRIQDDQPALDFFAAHSALSPEEYAAAAAAQESFWGEDLGRYPGFVEAVAAHLTLIREKGMTEGLKALLG